MAIETFNRFEYKYMINDKSFKKILPLIKEHMISDTHNKNDKYYSIYNMYFDTKDDHLIRTSLSRPTFKQKLRIRAYDDFKDVEEIVFLEIKKKYNKKTNKRRTKIQLKDALNFIKSGIPPEHSKKMNPLVMKELTSFINQEPLYMKTKISYDRLAFFDRENDNLRVSFDTNVIGVREDHTTVILPKGMHLMEIKASDGIPLWLIKIMSDHNLRRTRFSKYGIEYNEILKKQIGDEKNDRFNFAN